MSNLTKTSKITLTSFNPKRLGGLAETVQSLALGVLIGSASGTVNRKSPDGSQTFTGLAGAFEAYFTPGTDGTTKEAEASGVCFMPDTFQTEILALLSDKVDPNTGAVLEEGAESVKFAYEVGVKRAGNAAGYEWTLKPLNEIAPEGKGDPLADLRPLLANSSQPLLAAPKADAKATAKK